MTIDMSLLMDRSVYGDIKRAKDHISSLYRKAAIEIIHLIMDSASRHGSMPVDEFLGAELLGAAILSFEEVSNLGVKTEVARSDDRVGYCNHNIVRALDRYPTNLVDRLKDPLLFAAKPDVYDSYGPDHNHGCNIISEAYKHALSSGQTYDSGSVGDWAKEHVEQIKESDVYTKEEMEMFQEIGRLFMQFYDRHKSTLRSLKEKRYKESLE